MSSGDSAGLGTILAGKYRIDRLLGSGGMAVVAAAYHLQLRQRVAIKYLVPEALEYPELVERFTREARAVARIRGEHVARVIDVGAFDDGAPYIVLEYLEGEDLAQHLKKNGPLAIADVVRYTLHACEALAEAHTAKVVHRDLKPANLFLTKGPDHRKMVKVLDFGVSKIIDEPMTHPAKLLGTVVYMSPEQLTASHAVDLRTDIWSLGVIMYELLTGRPPFDGPTVVAVAQAITRNAPTPPSELRPGLPNELEAIIMRCLASQPADRHTSVLELARALGPFGSSSDRQSVSKITGVVCGSLAPPAQTIPPYDWTAAAAVPLRTPPVGMPTPLESEAPVSSPIRQSVPQPLDGPTARRSWLRSRRTWFASGALAVVAALGVREALTASPEGSTSANAAAAEPSEITVHLSSSASGARVRIDDGPLVELPMETIAPRDDRDHTITVEAPGHAPRTRTVRFSSNVYISFALTANEAPEATK